MAKNVFEIEGNVSQDVRVFGEEDKKCCFLTVAVGRDTGGGTDFIKCKAFKELAESIFETIKKGDHVHVFGHIATGSYKKGEETIYTQELIVKKANKLVAAKKCGVEVIG